MSPTLLLVLAAACSAPTARPRAEAAPVAPPPPPLDRYRLAYGIGVERVAAGWAGVEDEARKAREAAVPSDPEDDLGLLTPEQRFEHCFEEGARKPGEDEEARLSRCIDQAYLARDRPPGAPGPPPSPVTKWMEPPFPVQIGKGGCGPSGHTDRNRFVTETPRCAFAPAESLPDGARLLAELTARIGVTDPYGRTVVHAIVDGATGDLLAVCEVGSVDGMTGPPHDCEQVAVVDGEGRGWLRVKRSVTTSVSQMPGGAAPPDPNGLSFVLPSGADAAAMVRQVAAALEGAGFATKLITGSDREQPPELHAVLPKRPSIVFRPSREDSQIGARVTAGPSGPQLQITYLAYLDRGGREWRVLDDLQRVEYVEWLARLLVASLKDECPTGWRPVHTNQLDVRQYDCRAQ